MKNLVIHEKLADDFLVERNRTDLCYIFIIGIDTIDIHEKHDLN